MPYPKQTGRGGNMKHIDDKTVMQDGQLYERIDFNHSVQLPPKLSEAIYKIIEGVE